MSAESDLQEQDGRWIVEMVPPGRTVRLDEKYSGHHYSNLFYADLTGYLFNGQNDETPVAVNGKHIALAWKGAS